MHSLTENSLKSNLKIHKYKKNQQGIKYVRSVICKGCEKLKIHKQTT